MQLIGRDRELADVVERLTAGRRLVTLIGPGGIGKTALALATSDRLGPTFPLGAHFVDLSRVDRPDAIADAMAAQLGFSSFDALIQSPTEQPALVVVDNCEHVTDAAAEAIDALLANCRSPSVVATSRSPLDLPDESIVALAPLALGDGGDGGGREGSSGAVQLFLDRARHAGARADEPDLALVGELCRHLDGLPLAIEIAAARTRVLSVGEILRRLEQGIDVLARPRFRGAARHRSLRDTIGWSYRLLDDEAQLAFDRLGVCVGPFTPALAAAIAIDPAGDEAGALAVLDRLLDASLLSADTRQTPTRYRMLDTVRSAALAQLEQRGETDGTRERLADHVVATVTAVIDESRTSWGGELLGTLLVEFDNIAAALRHSLHQDTDPARAFVLYAVLWGVLHQGHLDEVRELGLRTFECWPEAIHGDETVPIAADAASTLAAAQLGLGHVDDAVATAERALRHAEGGLLAAVTLRRTLGLAARTQGEHDRAVTWFVEAAREARTRGVVTMALECDVFRAQVLADQGMDDEPLQIVREAAAAAREHGSLLNELWARTVEGTVLLAQDPASARPVVEATLAASREIDDPFGITSNLRALVGCDVALGDLAGAATATLEMLERIGRSGSGDLRLALESAAFVLHAGGRSGWEDLLATARTLPATIAMADAGGSGLPTELPTAPGRVLSRMDAIDVARRGLLDVDVDVDVVRVDADRVGESAREAPNANDSMFERAGDLWAVRYEGLAVHLRHSKGMDDLAALLARPGQEIHCLDLVGAGVEQSSAGARVDATARRQYEVRVRELQAEIDEADADHDIGRAERAREERDALVDELSAALGLGGRSRGSGSTAERARSAVAHRLRATIRRIAAVHPPLGRHLEVSISSGAYCAYRPERPTVWRTGRAAPE